MSLTVGIKTTIKEFEKRLNHIEKKQIPFATALALSNTARNAWTVERSNMGKEMTGPVKYTVSSLRWKRATKQNLEAKVYVLPRALGWLQWVVRGRQTKTARRRTLMIPVGLNRLEGTGRVLNRRLARAYRSRLLSDGTHFEGVSRTSGTRGIWKREADGGMKLVVLYVDSAEYDQTWNFYRNIPTTAMREFPGQFRLALHNAIRTSR